MSFRSNDFKKLRDEWYQKLEESGFEDIEDTGSEMEFLKVWHSSYFKVQKKQDDFRYKEAYYYEASHFLTQHQDCPLFFQDPISCEAWAMHSRGMSYRMISERLNQAGHKTNKDIINRIIKDIKKLMKVHG